MEHVIICFGCKRRVTQEEIAAGAHNHTAPIAPPQAPTQRTS